MKLHELKGLHTIYRREPSVSEYGRVGASEGGLKALPQKISKYDGEICAFNVL